MYSFMAVVPKNLPQCESGSLCCKMKSWMVKISEVIKVKRNTCHTFVITVLQVVPNGFIKAT